MLELLESLVPLKRDPAKAGKREEENKNRTNGTERKYKTNGTNELDSSPAEEAGSERRRGSP